jgi:hypothetical protein
MKIPALVRKTAALCLFMASGFASATMLTLPTPNSYEGQLFNNFNVYSLDLLQKCAADPRCQPQAGVPVASGPGQIADQAIVLTSANGMSNFTSPFASGSAVDDVILTPTGNQSSTFPNLPGYGSDAGGQFAGDQVDSWEINLGLLQSYLGLHDLVFLFDNNQGNARDAGNISVMAQVRVIDTAGNTVAGQCYELSAAGANAGCVAGGLVPVLSSLCVASDGSYNTIGASNQGDCPAGSLYVSNNLGTSTAEYAVFSQSLSNYAKNAANANYLLSVKVQYLGNEAGAEQLWICSQCDVGETHVPEPGSLLLLALGLLALLAAAQFKTRRT